jgi:hypothetical protein
MCLQLLHTPSVSNRVFEATVQTDLDGEETILQHHSINDKILSDTTIPVYCVSCLLLLLPCPCGSRGSRCGHLPVRLARACVHL